MDICFFGFLEAEKWIERFSSIHFFTFPLAEKQIGRVVTQWLKSGHLLFWFPASRKADRTFCDTVAQKRTSTFLLPEKQIERFLHTAVSAVCTGKLMQVITPRLQMHGSILRVQP